MSLYTHDQYRKNPYEHHLHLCRDALRTDSAIRWDVRMPMLQADDADGIADGGHASDALRLALQALTPCDGLQALTPCTLPLILAPATEPRTPAFQMYDFLPMPHCSACFTITRSISGLHLQTLLRLSYVPKATTAAQ